MLKRYYEYNKDYVAIITLDTENKTAIVKEFRTDKDIEFAMPYYEARFLAMGYLTPLNV